MKKDEHLKSYSADELRQMRERGEDRTDWEKVDAAGSVNHDDTDANLDWSGAQIVMPERKRHINLRIDADILRFFKNGGKGYQTRINAVLRSYMQSHQHNAQPPQ